MRRRGGHLLTGPDRRVTPPASMPPMTSLPPAKPSSPGPLPSAGHAPQGWECPKCHRVYAPWVACCPACGPGEGSREITEGRPGVWDTFT